MSAIANVTLTEHKGPFTGQGDYGPWTKNVYVADDGNEYQTFKAEIANQAHGFLSSGQQVTVVYESKQNGSFENRTIQSITANGQQQSPASPSQAVSVAPRAAQSTFEAEKNARISRAVGAKLALHAHAAGFETLSGYNDFERVAAGFARFVETGSVREQ